MVTVADLRSTVRGSHTRRVVATLLQPPAASECTARAANRQHQLRSMSMRCSVSTHTCRTPHKHTHKHAHNHQRGPRLSIQHALLPLPARPSSGQAEAPSVSEPNTKSNECDPKLLIACRLRRAARQPDAGRQLGVACWFLKQAALVAWWPAGPAAHRRAQSDPVRRDIRVPAKQV